MSRIEELEKRLAADPNSRIFVQLAEEYRKQGLLENAIEICEQGLEKHPQYPSARVALGRALLEAESYDRASEQFETVLAQVPDNILANKFLGETYHRLGRYDDAIQKYEIAQTLAPEDPELEGKIEAVKAEMAGGGPPAAADRAEPAETPPPPPVGDAPLEPTLAESPAAPPPTQEPPPPIPGPPQGATPPIPDSPEAPAAAPPPPAEAGDEGPPPAPADDLAPIPLVEVDEPMVLESPAESYARASERPAEEAPAEAVEAPEDADPVPLMSPSEPPPMPPAPPEPPSVEPPPADATSMEPPPMEPPPMEPPPMEPPPMEPPPMEPPSMEPPSMEPPPLEPPPLEPPPMEPPPAVETPPVVEAAPEPPPIEATPVEPIPFEPSAPRPTPPATEGDIDTPTMAELYATQGHFDKAVAVYRNLLARDPNATQYLERIEELEMLAKASADSTPAAPPEARDRGSSDAGTRQTIDVLERWLEEIRRSRRA